MLPGPGKVWSSFLTMLGNRTLFKHISVSFNRVLTGFSISFLCAFCLGMLAALKKDLEVYYGPYVEPRESQTGFCLCSNLLPSGL